MSFHWQVTTDKNNVEAAIDFDWPKTTLTLLLQKSSPGKNGKKKIGCVVPLPEFDLRYDQLGSNILFCSRA